MTLKDRIVGFLAGAILAASAAGAADAPFHVAVEPDVAVGAVKPVNGVGQPPMVGALKDWSMMHYLKEAGSKEKPFTLDMGRPRQSSPRCRVVDEKRTWKEIPLPAALPPRSVLLAEFDPQ